MKRWMFAVAALTAAAGLEGRAEYPTLKVRPKPLGGIPAYPYEPSAPPARPSVTGTGQSRIGVGIEGSPSTLFAPPPGTTTTTRESSGCRTVTTRRKTERTVQEERVTTTGPYAVVESVPGEAATFAMKDQELRVHHCSVSGISIVLYPDGSASPGTIYVGDNMAANRYRIYVYSATGLSRLAEGW